MGFLKTLEKILTLGGDGSYSVEAGTWSMDGSWLCKRCGTTTEIKRNDMVERHTDMWGPAFYRIKCPSCGQNIQHCL